jgi:peptidyl-prolyl cis-trans isomerase D
MDDLDLKNEILNLVSQKDKYDYNNSLLKKINNKEINDEEFKKMGKDKINSLVLNSIKDNKKFEINAVELLYSLPENSFTLINDEFGNIYLAQIKNIENQDIDIKNDKFNEYAVKQNTNNKNSILKSYDLLLNKKYNVVLNQKTIERVKNFFQ